MATKEKYYAVAIGFNAGVYTNFEKAKKQIKGFSYSLMRVFKSKKKAEEFVNLYKDENKKYQQMQREKERKRLGNRAKKKNINNRKDETVTIYVDGSFMRNVKVSSYGFVAKVGTETVQKDFGLVIESDFLELGSLGSELYSCLRAMEWAIANRYFKVKIVYDCGAIISMLNKKGLKGARKKFVDLYRVYSKNLEVTFSHAKNNKHDKAEHKRSHNMSRISLHLIP